ncbi:hypothetical protein J3Q64DRAFT_1704285 [Phycomyces blakesleeanus]|uniref:Uncharacterized protein n=1 Tax=Phycomyces blakesleeanus TaxID=4837 RepID=A0ABR3AHS4_PHYBL
MTSSPFLIKTDVFRKSHHEKTKMKCKARNLVLNIPDLWTLLFLAVIFPGNSTPSFLTCGEVRGKNGSLRIHAEHKDGHPFQVTQSFSPHEILHRATQKIMVGEMAIWRKGVSSIDFWIV